MLLFRGQTTMGEIQYYVTMSVTTEQEQAIRSMFKSYNWTCSMNVLTDDKVAELTQEGFVDIFPISSGEEHQSVDIRIKVEVADTDSDSENTEESPSVKQTSYEPTPVYPLDLITAGENLGNLTKSVDVEPLNSQPVVESPKESSFTTIKSTNADNKTERKLHSDSVSTVQNEEETTLKNKAIDDEVMTLPGRITRSKRGTLAKSGSLSTVTPGSQSAAANVTGTDLDQLNKKPPSSSLKAGGPRKPSAANTSVLNHQGIVSNNRMSNINIIAPGKNASMLPHGNLIPVIMPGSQTQQQLAAVLKMRSEQVGQPSGPFMTTVNGQPRMYYLQGPFPMERLVGPLQASKTTSETSKPIILQPPIPFQGLGDDGESQDEENFTSLVALRREQAERERQEELKKKGYLPCVVCGRHYQNKRKMRKHHYNTHRELMPLFECAVCGQKYNSRDDLRAHRKMAKHEDKYKFRNNVLCDICGKILHSLSSFCSHRKVHEDEAAEPNPAYSCDQCGALFKQHVSLKGHIERVHNYSPSKCEICGKEFLNKFRLHRHQLVHADSTKKYQCMNCDKAFMTKTKLQQHIRVHTKEKPFKCPRCDYVCSIKANLNKHFLNVHKEMLQAIDLRKSGASTSTSMQDSAVHPYTFEMANTENNMETI